MSLRNALGFTGEVGFFFLGVTFASTTTVLPAFLDALTGSAVLVGLAITLSEGAWRLPQLPIARWLIPKTRKKLYLTRVALISRPAYLVYGTALWLGVTRSTEAALALFFCLHLLMYASLSLDTLVWWDVFARAVPADRRGRVLGAGTVVQGLLSVGAGAVVAFALGGGAGGSANGFALLFVLSGIALMISLGFWTLVIEPAEAAPAARPDWKTFLRSVRHSLKSDRAFRQFLIVRILSGFDGLALGLYTLFALRVLDMPQSSTGIFVGVQTAGTVLGGAALGALSERFGSRRLIQLATAIGCFAPLIACTAALCGGFGSLNVLFSAVFLTMGVFSASLFVVFTTLAVELAPQPAERATYLGVFSTLSGVAVIWPMVGGWMLERTSYAVLFGVTAAWMVAAHVASWRMPRDSHARGGLR